MPRKQRVIVQRLLAVTGTFGAILALLLVLTDNLPLSLAATPLLALVCWKWWRLQLRNMFRVKRFAAVIPGSVYRSGQISRYRIARTLQKYRIRTVVDLTGRDDTDVHQAAERRVLARLGIPSRRFAMNGDGTGPATSVADAVTAIHQAREAGEPVLVHCAAGVQRTGHVLAAYMLLVEKADPDQVLRHLQRFGWCPVANPWHLQLNERMFPLAVLLQQRRVIANVPVSLPQLAAHRGAAENRYRQSPQNFPPPAEVS